MNLGETGWGVVDCIGLVRIGTSGDLMGMR
jgi:hypothetical protein